MKRIIVFSDSHGDVESMEFAIERFNPDLTLHLGDFITDALKLQKKYDGMAMEYVKGNCDYTEDFDAEKVIETGDRKIFITHGNQYGNARDIRLLTQAAESRKASLMLYGHTHIPTLTLLNGVTLLNPGSISKSKSGDGASFALIETDRDCSTCRILFTSHL